MIEIKSNAILRDGETIGRIDGDTAVMSAMPPGVVKGQIRKAAGNAGLAFVVEESTGLTVEKLQKAKEIMGMSGPEQVVTLEAGTMRMTSREPSMPRNLSDLEAAAEAGLIPMPPEKHPAMGDKTPAFVEWVRAHLSADDFQRHYHRRKIPASMQAFEAKDNLVTKRLNAAERNPETI